MFLYNLLKIGDSEINDFKIGTEQVDKIYLGTQLLWKKSNIYGWYVNPSISDSYTSVCYIEDATGKQPASTSMYRQVEYIKSTGTQIIITDILPNSNYSYNLDLQFTSANSNTNRGFFGTIEFRDNVLYSRINANWGQGSNTSFGVYFYNNNSADVLTDISSSIRTARNLLVFGPTSATYGGNALKHPAITMPTDISLPIVIFGVIEGTSIADYKIFQQSDMILYSCRIYDENNNLIHNLLPTERQLDGELGLYDTVANKFYTNFGTGNFVKGNYTANNYFDYGDWQNSFFMPKPCMLKSDGTVDYYLDENDYNFRTPIINLTSSMNCEWGGFYPYNNPDLAKRGKPIPPTDTAGYQKQYIRDITYYEIELGTTVLYGYIKAPITTPGGSLTLIYIYQYDLNKEFLDQQWSGGRDSRILYNTPGLPIPINPNTKYIRITYGQYSNGQGGALPEISDPSYYNDKFVISYEPIMSDISDSTYDGNAMVEWPTIYYKFETLEDKGYKQVEYIKSNGTQIIQTDIIPTSTTKIEVDLRFGNNVSSASGDSGKAIFGATEYENNASIAQYRINAQDTTSLKCLTFYNKFTWHQGQVDNYLMNPNNFNSGSTNVKQTLILNVGIGSWGNQSIDFTSEISSSFRELTIPIALFGVVDSTLGGLSPHTIKELEIYNVRMYSVDSQLIHNLIPVERQSDNELGLYDTITDKFYTNAGTGTFVKGNYITENHGWFYCSDTKVDDSYNCWNNYDCYNHIIPHFYTPIYNTTISNNKMRSLSGIALTTANGSGTTTGRLELDSALANNTTPDIEWYSGVWSDRVLISALMILISKSLNNQAIFGNGINTQANKEAYITGTLNDKGLFYGSFADNASGVKIFGMENFYGCVGQRIAGLVGTDTGYAYKLTYGNIDGSNVDTYNDSGLGYKFIANQPNATSTLNWVDKMHFGDYGVLPISVSGGANTYWADSFWSGTNYAVIGRNDSNSDYATGSLSMDLTNSFSTASWNISGSLSCKPVLRLTNVDTANLRIHSENIINYRPNGNSTVEVQLYVKNSSYLPAYDELTGRIILPGSTATSIDDEKIYVLDIDNEWKVMYEIEQN